MAHHNHHDTRHATRSCIAVYCPNTAQIGIVLSIAMVKKLVIRQSCWKNDQAPNETVKMIADAIEPSCPQLMMLKAPLYESENMGTGIHQETLTKWADTLLKNLILLDARGGIYAQSDIYDAMKKLGDDDKYKPVLEKAAAERNISVTM